MPSVASFALAVLLPAAAVARTTRMPQSAAVTGSSTTSIAPLDYLFQPIYASVIKEVPGTTLYALQCGCSDPKTASAPCPCGVLNDESMTLTAGPTSWAYTYFNVEEQISTAYNCSVEPEAKTGACLEYLSQGGYVFNGVKSIFGKGYSAMFTSMIITAGPTSGVTATAAATEGGAAATKSGSSVATKSGSSSQASPTSSSLATKNVGESFALAGAVAFGAAALAL